MPMINGIEHRTSKAGVTTYRVKIKASGTVIESKTFKTLKDARAWQRARLAARDRGEIAMPSRAKITVEQLVAEFLDVRKADANPSTHRTDRNNLERLPKSWMPRRVSSITSDDVAAHLRAELADRAPSTVQRQMGSIAALFTHAVSRHYVPTNPVTGKRLPEALRNKLRAKPKIDVPTAERMSALITAARKRNPHYADLIEFDAATALRRGELRALKISALAEVPLPGIYVDASHSDGWDRKEPKSLNGTRFVPLTARALEIARKHAAGRGPDEYLFVGITFGKRETEQLNGRAFGAFLRRLPGGPTVHAIRHYAISTWLRAGVPLHQAAAWAGDNPKTVNDVYAHVLGEAQDREAIARLNALMSQRGPTGVPTLETERALPNVQ